MSGALAITSPTVVDYLAKNGIANLDYSSINYFTNAGDTRTRGVDFVGWVKDAGNIGTFTTTLSANYNQNVVTSVKPNPAVLDNLGINLTRLNRQDIKGYLANSSPRSKLILNEQYAIGNWSFNGTLTRYGRYTSYLSNISQYGTQIGRAHV